MARIQICNTCWPDKPITFTVISNLYETVISTPVAHFTVLISKPRPQSGWRVASSNQSKWPKGNKCLSTLTKKPLLIFFLFLCYSWKCKIALYSNYIDSLSYTNIPQLMSESAIVKFPKHVAKNIFLWPLLTDIHIRLIIQVGSLGFQNVLFGPVEGIIEYFILSCLRLLPCLTPHPRLHQNLIVIWKIFVPGFQVNFWFWELSSSIPQQMQFLWGETYGWMKTICRHTFFILLALLILFPSLINRMCLFLWPVLTAKRVTAPLN